MKTLPRLLEILVGAALLVVPATAQPPTPPPHSVFVTLGTMAGPIPNPHRSQPANLLLWRDRAILIDAGDGAAEQIAKAGVSLSSVHALFLSHLHFDHTGGLFALLGMRYQVLTPGILTIYGPPGTRRLVDGLIAAMQPAAEVGAGFPGARRPAPDAGIIVQEIGDGAQVAIGDIQVTAARNSHYSYPEGSPEAERFQSLSLRFDLPDRSIVYTGDTGPSAAVERLARGADLLVSEVIDPVAALEDLRRSRPDLPAALWPMFERHFRDQHLTAAEAGRLARNGGVHRLILTHVATGERDVARTRATAAEAFGGPVSVANDLDRY